MLVILLVVFLVSLTGCSSLEKINQTVFDEEYASMPVLFHLDNYDQCMLKTNALYCTFTFKLQPKVSKNESNVWQIVKKISADPRNYRHDLLRHGVCVTTACPSAVKLIEENVTEHLETCYNRKYEHLGVKGNITNISCENGRRYPVDSLDIAIGTCFGTYAIFIIFASFYEGIARYKPKEAYEKITATTYGKIISAFSIPKNWYRLRSPNKNPDAIKLRSIQGIRFYNMICVILCHTLMMTFAGPISNTKYTENLTRQLLNMFIANGHYAVQTFFVISGWLLSYHFFQMLESGKTMSFKYLALAFLNRYIRLTPTLIVMIAFEATWLVHLGNGPQWENFVGKEHYSCRRNWWTNLLFINNYVNKKEMCLHQTWYVATDTQLFLLSLLLLMLVSKNLKMVKITFFGAILTGLIVLGTVAYINNYDIIIRQYPETLYNLQLLQRDDWHDLYSSSYSNISGYIIGLTFGYIFYKYKNKVLATRTIHTVVWWILSFGVCNFVIFIAAKMYSPYYTNTRLESALYWAFGKSLFAFGIAVGIFGMTQNIGWFVKWFCEWEAVQIFGRLTYSTYIIHTCLIRIRAGYIRSPVFVNDYVILCMTLGDIVLSYLGGTILCLCCEMPISALQKLMIPRHTDKLELSFEKRLKSVDTEHCESYESNKNNMSTKV